MGNYMQEKYTQHKEYVEKELEGCSGSHRTDVLQSLIKTWPSDEEVKKMVTEKKKQIANEASDEEVAEVFKNIRV